MHPALMQTHFTSPRSCLYPTPGSSLTYGDVEAIDAEGGTPTLSKPMLLGLGFHLCGHPRAALTRLGRLLPVAVSCLSFLRGTLSSWGEKKKKKKRCSPPTPVSAERWEGAVTLTTSRYRHRAGEFLSGPSSPAPPPLSLSLVFVVDILSLPLSRFSHLNKLISRSLWLLICFPCLDLPPPPPTPLSLLVPLPPRGTVGVCGGWGVGGWVVVVVGRGGHL